jgi:hypothetical protein
MATKVVKAKEATSEPVTALTLVGNQSGVLDVTNPSRPFIPIKWVPQAEGVDMTPESLRVTLARMVVVNGGSPAMKKETRVPGAEIGLFLNTDTQEVSQELGLVFLYPFICRYFSYPKMSKPPVCMSVDGSGAYGVCPSGQYANFNIPTKMVEVSGVKQEAGVCATCPKSQRAWGTGSECSEVLQMVCCKASVIENWAEYTKRLQAGDLSVGNDLLNELFILQFKSSSMTLGKQILERIFKDGAAFAWKWNFTTALTSNTQGDWYNPIGGRVSKLDADETIFARSMYQFAKSMKPIHTDIEEVVDEPGVDTDIKGLE